MRRKVFAEIEQLTAMCTPQLNRKAKALKALSLNGGFGVSNPFVLLIDFDMFNNQLNDCKSSFGEHWKHCFAVKANPTRLVLAEVKKAGFGLEAASIGELRMASRAGVLFKDVVYDSPVKSFADLREALQSGVILHIDNFQELECVAEILKGEKPKNFIGMRVNPQAGVGTLDGFSTGTMTSKFGVGLRDHNGTPVLEAYKKFPFLRSIMCHMGSQGIGIELAVQGIRETVDFALAVNKAVGYRQIEVIDIGGGLSTNFSSDEHSPTFKEYAAALREKVPELFDPKIFSCVITEFGRALVAKTGFFASRVEYVKTTGGRAIVLQYAGADTCVRTVYHPKEWPLRVSILDENFSPRGGDGVLRTTGGLSETDIAGPCCIQADIVAHKRMLPPVRRGDTVLLHDVGGYYHSGHTRYNLRQNPPVWSYKNGDKSQSEFVVTMIQPGETVDQTLDAFCERRASL